MKNSKINVDYVCALSLQRRVAVMVRVCSECRQCWVAALGRKDRNTRSEDTMLDLQMGQPSPLLFCLPLDPRCNLIDEQGHIYTVTTNKITSKEIKKGDASTRLG